MAYRVLLTSAAQRQLDRLRGVALVAVRGTILSLGAAPRPAGAVMLSGQRTLWRIRLRVDGVSWRIVYLLDDGARKVIVTRVARRDEGTYREL